VIKININNKFINLAIDEAKKGDHKQKVGCIIFDKKKIVSYGHNTSQRSARKLHPKFQRYPFSVHAEVDAILKAKTDLKGMSILVIRVNRRNEFRTAKPCKNCLKYLYHVGIKKIFYSINNYPYIEQLHD
jgi:dCMP deaminase